MDSIEKDAYFYCNIFSDSLGDYPRKLVGDIWISYYCFEFDTNLGDMEIFLECG